MSINAEPGTYSLLLILMLLSAHISLADSERDPPLRAHSHVEIRKCTGAVEAPKLTFTFCVDASGVCTDVLGHEIPDYRLKAFLKRFPVNIKPNITTIEIVFIEKTPTKIFDSTIARFIDCANPERKTIVYVRFN
jgi:hypothetical protein